MSGVRVPLPAPFSIMRLEDMLSRLPGLIWPPLFCRSGLDAARFRHVPGGRRPTGPPRCRNTLLALPFRQLSRSRPHPRRKAARERRAASAGRNTAQTTRQTTGLHSIVNSCSFWEFLSIIVDLARLDTDKIRHVHHLLRRTEEAG